MLSTFSRSVPSKVYEAWIFLIRFLVSCIILHLAGWNLIPHFLAQEPNRSISLWSFIVSTSSVTIANTVISKKSYFRLNIWWDVIYVQREQQWTKNGALGDTRQNRCPIRFFSIYNNSLLSEAKKKRIYPFQGLATNSIAKQFAFKEFMRSVSNAFSKSNMNVSTCPLLSKILAHSFITVVNWVSQLCPFLNACCLSESSLYSRWAMIFEHTMCLSNLQGTQVKETGR